MRPNRHTAGAVAATTAVLVGTAAALAASPQAAERSARCEARVARIAERRGVTVEQLTTNVRTRLLARIDAAAKAGRITSERAARLRDRLAQESLCDAVRRHAHPPARLAVHGMLRSAARFLGLDRRELRTQLPGSSLAALAQNQGKSEAALEAAMVAPAEQRLAKAVASGRLTQARAEAVLERLKQAADRLAHHVFPSA